MTTFEGQDIVVCRPALQKDTDDVLEISSHIWEGSDYLPFVWQDWLKDRDGMLGVAELGVRVVGVFKLTRFQANEWYLEGLRVHPDVQGRGIAAHIHDYVVETWRQMGKGVLRLTTGSYNVKVHHMCEQSGFKRIAEFIPYRATALGEDNSNFSLIEIDETRQAMDFVVASPTHAFSWGLINLGWVFGDPQLKHLEEAVGKHHAWWWNGRQGFLSVWEDDESEKPEPGVQLLACSEQDICELLLDYRRLMGKIGYESAGWVAPNQPEVIACLEKAGFQRTWDVSLYIFELRS